MIIVDTVADWDEMVTHITVRVINKKTGAFQVIKRHDVKSGTKADKQWAHFLNKYKSEYTSRMGGDCASWHKDGKYVIRTYIK